MTSFSDSEILLYLKSQRMARIATTSPQCKPNVSRVAFEIDRGHCFVGSHNQEIFFRTKKYKDSIDDNNKQVALVIDEQELAKPWRTRGAKVNNTTEILEQNGIFGPGKYLQLTPTVSWSRRSGTTYTKMQRRKRHFFVKTVHSHI